MTQAFLRQEDMIAGFRRGLPKQSATAQAIDRQAPWQQIALDALADGYEEFAKELTLLIEACVRRGV